jgi:amidase
MRLRFVVMAMLSAGMAANQQMAKAADLTGRWVAEVIGPNLLEPAYAHVTLQRTGDSLSGMWGPTTIKGSVAGSDLKLAVSDAEGRDFGAMSGRLTGDVVEGSGMMAGLGRRGGGFPGANNAPGPVAMSFKLTRELAAPAKSREITYEPTTFQSYYFAGNKPGIHIFPGDVVHTWAPDSAGMDKDLKRGPIMLRELCPGTRWLCI